MKLHELSDHRLIDTIRVIIGLDPLHLRTRALDEGCGSYLRFEALRRAADPECETCGGSGYYDGERLEARCVCTGLPQRARGFGVTPACRERAAE